MPISRVRSVTDTSMMFITPIPPTTSEMPAMLPSSIDSTSVTSLEALMRSSWLWTTKSGSATRCCRSSKSVTCALTSSLLASGSVWTLIWLTLTAPEAVLKRPIRPCMVDTGMNAGRGAGQVRFSVDVDI